MNSYNEPVAPSLTITDDLQVNATTLAGLISLFGIACVEVNSESWDTDCLFVSIAAANTTSIPDDVLKEIERLAESLFTNAFDKHLANLDEYDNDNEHWSGDISVDRTEKDVRLRVEVSYNFENETSSEVTLVISPDEPAFKLIQENSITSLEFQYSGSGDSGGMNEFLAMTGPDTKAPREVEEQLQDLLEERIYNEACAIFDGDGSNGYGELNPQVTSDGCFEMHIEHYDVYTDCKGFETYYSLNMASSADTVDDYQANGRN